MLERDCEGLIGAAISVHRTLGPGLLESIYSRCLGIELEWRGFRVHREVPIPLKYRGITLDGLLRIDLIVNNRIVVEVKSVIRHEPVFEAQLLTYLRLTGHQVGYLLNFHKPVLKDGIKRMVR
ncbi:MAG: GxxExxY protein [Gemmatimonadaceae bacterium]|nr:GxxExxY protein [Gemmatimonadaceae bacterium]